MKIYIYWCNANSSTCCKVCSIHRIEVILTTRSSLIFCRLTVVVVVCCVIDCKVPLEARLNNFPTMAHHWMAAHWGALPRIRIGCNP
jgi:hypothetical protein